MGVSNYLPNNALTRPGICTSTTRPASPYEGQAIYETDTDVFRFWNGSTWQPIQLPADVVANTLTATTGPVVSRGTSAATGVHTGVSGSPARFYSTAGDNWNIRTHTNTPNPNFSLGVQNGSGTDTHVPIDWGTAGLNLRGNGTSTAVGLRVGSDNVPRYVNKPNPYGWHPDGQPLGTEMVIGAWGASGFGFSTINTWFTLGAVNVTIPNACSVIEMIYGFTIFVSGAGAFQVRMLYSGTGGAATFQYFRNVTFDHFCNSGTMGLSVVPGTGTISLQIFGQGITLNGDANDSGYFTVHTV